MRDEILSAVDVLLVDAVGAALAGAGMAHDAVDCESEFVAAWVKVHMRAFDELLKVLERCSCDG